MIHSLDKWLIDQVYQRVVDFTQRHPHWLAGQSALLCAVCAVVQMCLKYSELEISSLVLSVFGIACISGLAVTTKYPYLMVPSAMDFFLRQYTLWCFLIGLALDLLVWKFTPLADLAQITFMSFFYFAACHPPAPPKPRTRLASAGGAA